MSINIYLNEAIREEVGFTDKPYSKDGNGGIKFAGMNLFTDKGRLYAMLGETDIVPQPLENFVTDVSLYDFISCERTRRELGIYKHEDAEAEVELQSAGRDKLQYMLKIKAKSLKTAWELIRKIKVGSIRPAESYEGQQQGKSRLQLEVEFAELQNRVEEIQHRVEGALSEMVLVKGRIKAVQKFAAELVNEKLQWPWCSKKAVADKIILAMNAG